LNQWWKPAAVGFLVILVVVVGAELMGAATRKVERKNFTGKTLKGEAWNLADHRGRRPVVVNFFATWCSPCQQELPELLEIKDKYRDRDLELVVVTDEPAADILNSNVAEARVTFLVDAQNVKKAYGIDAIPHTIVFNREGEVEMEIHGYDPGMQGLRAFLDAQPARQASGAASSAGFPR
jgi:thiol-disulfide isomerase/thioredoxin